MEGAADEGDAGKRSARGLRREGEEYEEREDECQWFERERLRGEGSRRIGFPADRRVGAIDATFSQRVLAIEMLLSIAESSGPRKVEIKADG